MDVLLFDYFIKNYLPVFISLSSLLNNNLKTLLQIHLVLALICISIPKIEAQGISNDPSAGQKEREYLIKTMTTIADPVLLSLSKNELRKKMPVESQPGKEEDRKKYSYLEALGRLLSGMSPWLELGGDKTEEGKLREH